MDQKFILEPFIDIDINVSGRRFVFHEPSAAAALAFLTKGTGPDSTEFYKSFLDEYVSPSLHLCERAAKLSLLEEIQKVLSFIPFADLQPPQKQIDPFLAVLQEADEVGARYGICPFSVLEKYSLRALHLLFWAAHNAEIERIKLQVKLSGGKVDKIQRLRLQGEVIEAEQLDKWARAKELAKKRKEFYNRQKEE